LALRPAPIHESAVRGCVPQRQRRRNLFALETIRRRRRFRSVGFTEAWEKVAQTYDALATLTRCELETVRGVAGRQNKEIADERGRSVKTIDRHRANAVRKLRTRGLAELLRFAIGHGVVES